MIVTGVSLWNNRRRSPQLSSTTIAVVWGADLFLTWDGSQYLTWGA